MKTSCQYGDLVLAVSNFTRQDLENRFNINAEKIAVINEGVEERFQVIKDEQRLNKTLSKYNLEKRFLFYSGSLSPRKNLKRVIEAFKNIKNDIPHDLVLTGTQQWGSHELDSNLGDRLKVIGYVGEDELVDLYNSADLYLYPSLYEGFGLPILEAQRCGCPVLTSNITSCPEVAGEGALIVDPYSAEEIAAGILKILQDHIYRDELIEKGYKNLERYSWRQTAKQILKVLRPI